MNLHTRSARVDTAWTTGIVAAVLLFASGVAYFTFQGTLVGFAIFTAGVLFVVLIASHLRLALVLAVLFVPIEEFFIFGAAGTVTRFLMIGLAGSYLFHLLRGRLRPRWGALSPVGWLWFCWVAASLVWSVSPQIAQFTSLIQLVLLAFLVAAIIAERPTLLPTVLWAYTLSACTIALLGVVRFFSGVSEAGPVRTSAGEGQGVEHFAAYLLPALVYLLLQVFSLDKRWYKAVGLSLLSVVLILAILLSGTRSAWMGGAAALLLIVLPRQRPRRVALASLAGLLLLGGVLQLPAVNTFLTARTTQALEDGGAGRVDIWRVGLGIAGKAPITGVGFGNFPAHFGVQEIRESTAGLQHRFIAFERGPHSIYLGTLAELGIIGFALMIAWFLPLLITANGGTTAALAVKGALLAYLVQAIYLDILNRKYFWLFLGLAEGCRLVLARRERIKSDASYTDSLADQRLSEPG